MPVIRSRLVAARRAARRHPLVEPPPEDPGYGAPQSMAAMSLTEAQDVTVPADAHYVYDLGASPAVTLGHITINGKLTYADGSAQTLTAKSITNNGVHWATSDGSRRVAGRKLRLIINGLEEDLEAAYMVDQTGSTGAGNGVLKRLWQSFTTAKKPTANQTVVLTFTGTGSTFSVKSNYPAANTDLGTGTVGVMFDNVVRFLVEQGSVPFAAGHTRTLRVERKASHNNSRSRGIRNMSGASTRLLGPEKLAWTRLLQTNGTLTVSGTVLPLEHVPNGWAVGDRVAVTTTDYYDRSSGVKGITERFTITAVDLVGKTITLNTAMSHARCAAKQYVAVTSTDVNGRKVGGMSLTDSGWQPPVAGGARVVDMRAFVLNLTREIVIEAPDDAAWQDTTNGRLGVHVMNMGLDSEFIFDQVEIVRGGQRGRHGRYPLHNHIPSYNLPDGGSLPSDGTFLGDVDETKQYVKGCAIWLSAQHGVQNHGACGWKVYETVLDDIVGHGFNLEDGSELRYGFIDCYASECKSVPASTTLQLKAHQLGGSGFWLTNLGGDCYGGGASSCHINLWKSPSSRVFGLTRDVDEYPINRRPGRIENMTHTSQRGSVLVMNASHVSDERGAVEGSMTNLNAGTFYFPTDNDRPDGSPVRPTLLKGFHLYKSHGDAYFNRVGVPEYVEVTASDNRKTVFTGAVNAGRLSKSLLVGKSLHDTPYWVAELHRAGSASYHGAQIVVDSAHVNFPPTRPADGVTPIFGNFDAKGGLSELRGGANQTADFYDNPIEFTTKRWTGNEFISAEPMAHTREWSHRKLTSGEADVPAYNTSLAPGVLDAQGWWGPVNWWRTLNLPFYTTGLTDSAPVIMNFGVNATVDPYFVATPDKIYAFREVSMETDVGTDAGKTRAQVNVDLRCSELNVWLQDASYANVAQYVLGRCQSGAMLCHKRFVGFRKNQRYHVSLGITATPSQWSQWGVFAADEPDDIFIVSVPWGANTATVYMWSGFTHQDQAAPSGQANGLLFASVANLAALEAHAGNAFWLDAANDRIYLKYRGGQLARPSYEVPSSYDLWNQSIESKPNTIYIKP